jgi:hypothetical protein
MWTLSRIRPLEAFDRRSPALPAVLAAVAVWVAWGRLEGGFAATRWGAFGVAILVLLGLSLAALRARIDLSEPARWVCLGSLALFCVWNFLSILWADFPGDAWAAADVTLLYGAGFALVSLWRSTPTAARLVLGAFVAGVTVVGAITLVTVANDPAGGFLDGRLLTPVGYPNGTVTLWMSAAWPALLLATDAWLARAVRVAALGACGFLVELAVLGQSRAWALFLPLLFALALALTRQRLRLLLAALLVAAAAGAAGPRLLDVHDALTGEADGGAVSRAAWAVAVSCAVLCVAGTAWALLDGRVRIDGRARIALGAAAAAAALAGVAAGAAVFVHEVGDPGAWIGERWDEFTAGRSLDVSGSRFTASASSGRYQEWRVAWNEFLDHPVAGIGADNFAAAYLEHRNDDFREPRFPHSLELRVLSQLGIVGTCLLGTFLVSACSLALRRRRLLPAPDAPVVAAAAMVFLSWLVSGSVDWFWEIPALAAPALGFLALAGSIRVAPPGSAEEPLSEAPEPAPVALAVPVRHADDANVAVGTATATPVPTQDLAAPTGRGRGEPGASRRLPRTVAVAAAVGGVLALGAAAVSVGLPALAASYTDAGLSGWARDPARAYRNLERAADLDPLSGGPLLLEGSIALRVGDEDRARDAFERVLEREPRNWYANLQLAMLYGSRGERALARTYLRRAQELNPNDKVARRVETLLARGKPIDPNELNERYRNAFDRRSTGGAAQ